MHQLDTYRDSARRYELCFEACRVLIERNGVCAASNDHKLAAYRGDPFCNGKIRAESEG